MCQLSLSSYLRPNLRPNLHLSLMSHPACGRQPIRLRSGCGIPVRSRVIICCRVSVCRLLRRIWLTAVAMGWVVADGDRLTKGAVNPRPVEPVAEGMSVNGSRGWDSLR